MESKRPRIDKADPPTLGSASALSKVALLPFIPHVEMRNWEKVTPAVTPYRLTELLRRENVSVRRLKNKNDKDEAGLEYVKKVMGERMSKYSLALQKDKGVDAIKQMMYPVYANLRLRPDVCLYRTSSPDTSLPILQVELNSGETEHTHQDATKKLTFGLIEQFRVLSNFCDDGSNLQLAGFVFPSWNDEMYVTEVTISWEKVESSSCMGFKVFGKPLCLDNVKDRVQSAVDYTVCIKFQSNIDGRSFLKLSAEHIKALECSDVHNLQQVETPSSLLLKNENVYIKVYRRHVFQSVKMLALLMTIDAPEQINSLPLLIPQFHKRIKNALIFPALPHQPLTKYEAKSCLGELVNKLFPALKTIHERLEVAHLDVRLPNICFRETGDLVLVDPDRVQGAHIEATRLSEMYHPSDLYKAESGWLMQNIDWKQLGHLIVDVVGMSVEEAKQDEFIRILIDTGTYDDAKAKKSMVATRADMKKSIMDVLRERNLRGESSRK